MKVPYFNTRIGAIKAAYSKSPTRNMEKLSNSDRLSNWRVAQEKGSFSQREFNYSDPKALQLICKESNVLVFHYFASWVGDDHDIPAQENAESEAPTVDSELEIIFKGLSKKWREATGGYSLTYRRFAHPTYLSLLVFAENNKEEIIPLILRELKDRPDWWFEALKFLTNADPTKKGDNFTEAAKAWLKWGVGRKLIT
jgi:hypothetical protein